LEYQAFRPVTGRMLLVFVVVAVFTGVGAVLAMGALLRTERGILLAMGALYGAGLFAIVVAVLPLRRDALPALALRPAGWRSLVLGPLATVLLSLSVSQIGPELQGMKDVGRIVQQPGALLFSLLFLGVLAPLVEELVFRGLLYGWLEGRWGWQWAYWVSSLGFALAHYQWGAAGWARLYYALAVLPLGLMFGWLRRRTGSLLPSFASHLVNNSFAVFGAYYGF
jgi:uncharacterized protein